MAKEVDASLNPGMLFRRGVSIYHPPYHRAYSGEAYFRIRQAISAPIDAVVVVPWLKPGGADRWAIALTRVLAVDRGMRVLVLATEPSDSPWRDRLPSGVQFLEIGSELASLHFDGDDGIEVLTRLLVQLAPSDIHVVGSRHGWAALRKHGPSLKAVSKIYASLFCDELDEAGIPSGYAESCLAACSPWIDAVLVDNRNAPAIWQRRHGLPASFFIVADFPAPSPSNGSCTSPKGSRVLWAGRFDRQKRLDLVAEIARLTPELHWDVHGAPIVPGHGASVSMLKQLPNVTLHGPFDAFTDIVDEQHGLFVYTSSWDGMPTILLDAARAQLPIIASNVGGVPDFLGPDALIQGEDEAIQFAAAARRVISDPLFASRLVREQNAALARRTWERFSMSIP
ncbi:glycosyltransferase family 4 protein [Silanimonas lenta]|jgi:glycosyltransferase involved in cell wall biosynthesis|uniref:glycosyltransferase family 4 protein n=1 Tax=Silanimonas lenta TaxID=265429 RepID=UPI000A005AB8|nr:glycosyltransferase family 4 protein [Silanimonas lenta]